MNKPDTTLILGCGSLGFQLVKDLIRQGHTKIRIFDTSEQALHKIKQLETRDTNIRLILGDIRDYEKVESAMSNVDIVIHTAARKFMDLGEYNPIEFISSNINGVENVGKACIKNNVNKAIFISSDKAVSAINFYGMTKALGERLWTWYGNIQNKTDFIIIRPCNFWQSDGSVFDSWELAVKNDEPIRVTNPDMTRYFITLEDMSNFILNNLDDMSNRETWVPNGDEYKIIELARGYTDRIYITQNRLNEKLEEDLFTQNERDKMIKVTGGWKIEGIL